MKNVLQILKYSDAIQCTEEIEERFQMYLRLSRLDAMHFDRFLHRKLRSALQTFRTTSDSRILTEDGLELLFLSRVVFKEVEQP